MTKLSLGGLEKVYHSPKRDTVRLLASKTMQKVWPHNQFSGIDTMLVESGLVPQIRDSLQC